LANILAGFIPIDKGINVLPDKRFVSGLIEPYYFIPGTVKQQLSFGEKRKEKKIELISLLEKYNLKEKLNQNVFELSYGQKKKLYLILTMTSRSNIYIYDEPLKGIDKTSQSLIFCDLIAFAKQST